MRGVLSIPPEIGHCAIFAHYCLFWYTGYMRSFKQWISPFLNRHFELDHTGCICQDVEGAFWRDGKYEDIWINGVMFTPENPLLDPETGDIIKYLCQTYGMGAIPVIIRDLEATLKDYREKMKPRR